MRINQVALKALDREATEVPWIIGNKKTNFVQWFTCRASSARPNSTKAWPPSLTDRFRLLVELVDVDLDVVKVRLDRSEGKKEPLRQLVWMIPLQRHTDVKHEVLEEAVTISQTVRRELPEVVGVHCDLEVPLPSCLVK